MSKYRKNWLGYIAVTMAIIIGFWIGLQSLCISPAFAFEWSFNTDHLDSIVGTPPEPNSKELERDLTILRW